jgi:hypothetical protein
MEPAQSCHLEYFDISAIVQVDALVGNTMAHFISAIGVYNFHDLFWEPQLDLYEKR